MSSPLESDGRWTCEPERIVFEQELEGLSGSIPVFGDVEFGIGAGRLVPRVVPVPVEESDKVCILLNTPGLTKVRHLRLLVVSPFYLPVELREGQDMAVHLPCESFELPADVGDLGLSGGLFST